MISPTESLFFIRPKSPLLGIKIDQEVRVMRVKSFTFGKKPKPLKNITPLLSTDST